MNITKEIRKIFQKGYDEKHKLFQSHCVETEEDMGDLLEDALLKAKEIGEIKDYQMSCFDFDGGPGYSSGVIVMSWVTNEGELKMDSYVWEAV